MWLGEEKWISNLRSHLNLGRQILEAYFLMFLRWRSRHHLYTQSHGYTVPVARRPRRGYRGTGVKPTVLIIDEPNEDLQKSADRVFVSL